MNTEALYLVEINAYDPALGTTRVLRYSNIGYTTKPAESPANAWYDARLKQPVDIARTMFAGGATMGRSTNALGDLVLLNGDGALDDLDDLGFDGQTVTIRRASVFNPSYPADFASVTLTMDQMTCDTNQIVIKLRDLLYTLANAQLQTTKYLGNNSLPNGLEGVSDLAGKPKPVCLGAVMNISPPCVNTSKLIYQVHDGIAAVNAVRDRGALISSSAVWNEITTNKPFSTTTFQNIPMWYVNGRYFASQNGVLKTSTDFATWTTVTVPANTPTDMTFGAGLYVITGIREIYTSPDLVTWTSRTWPGGVSDSASTVKFLGGQFILGMWGNARAFAYSSDGITWTQSTSTGMSFIRAVAFGGPANSTYVAIGWDTSGSQATTASSPDGHTWTVRASGYGPISFSTVSWFAEGGLFVAMGSMSGSSALITSPDGFTWTVRPGVSTPNHTSQSQISLGGLLYSIDDRHGLSTSADGINWVVNTTAFDVLGGADGLYCMISDGTKLWVVDAALSAPRYFSSGIQPYATIADLQDDTKAPTAGSYITYASASGTYVRLGSSPAGTVTADVTQGAFAANRTAAQLWTQALQRAGLSSANWSTGDVTALDAVQAAVLGYWTMNDGVLCADVADEIAQSVGAWWSPDRTNVLRIQQLTAPSGTPAYSFVAADMKKPLERITSNDVGNGLPVYRTALGWGQYYTVQTSDLAGIVTNDRRAQLAQQWRNVVVTDPTVLAAHPLSQPFTVNTLLAAQSDATTEANRVQALRGAKRDLWEFTVELNAETFPLDLGNVIEIVYPRFALSMTDPVTGATLSAGALFRIIDVRPNAANKEVTYTVWGRVNPSRFLVTDDGFYLVADSGEYLLTKAES